MALADRFAPVGPGGDDRDAALGAAGRAAERLDLDAGTLNIEETLMVAGAPEESDGKTRPGSGPSHSTLHGGAAPRLRHARRGTGASQSDEAITAAAGSTRTAGDPPGLGNRRFNRLVDRAGVRRIRLHDVRHTYATLALNAGVEPKIVSDRVGHSNLGYTLTIYTHRSTGAIGRQPT